MTQNTGTGARPGVGPAGSEPASATPATPPPFDRPNAAVAAAQVDAAPVKPPPPRLTWMGITHQWGTRVKPGKHGLRLGDLNVGIYGEVPAVWNDQTRNPRGAVARRGIPPVGYSIRDKADLWADCAADLYEEAIQRRWAPATDVPWATLATLPDDLESAICQVATELSQYANVDVEAVTHWQHQMAYGYHEVKQFLATVSFDAARHLEAFRKRALGNGGGLGMESRGLVNRMILESRGGWTESVVYQYLMRGTYQLEILTALHASAHNDAERFIFAKLVEDQARHVAYGYDHLKYAVTHQPGESDVMQTLLFLGEAMLGVELAESPMRSALAIIFGGGIEAGRGIGMQTYLHLAGEFVRRYLAVCEWIGVPRLETLNPLLKKYLDH